MLAPNGPPPRDAARPPPTLLRMRLCRFSTDSRRVTAAACTHSCLGWPAGGRRGGHKQGEVRARTPAPGRALPRRGPPGLTSGRQDCCGLHGGGAQAALGAQPAELRHPQLHRVHGCGRGSLGSCRLHQWLWRRGVVHNTEPQPVLCCADHGAGRRPGRSLFAQAIDAYTIGRLGALGRACSPSCEFGAHTTRLQGPVAPCCSLTARPSALLAAHAPGQCMMGQQQPGSDRPTGWLLPLPPAVGAPCAADVRRLPRRSSPLPCNVWSCCVRMLQLQIDRRVCAQPEGAHKRRARPRRDPRALERMAGQKGRACGVGQKPSSVATERRREEILNGKCVRVCCVWVVGEGAGHGRAPPATPPKCSCGCGCHSFRPRVPPGDQAVPAACCAGGGAAAIGAAAAAAEPAAHAQAPPA